MHAGHSRSSVTDKSKRVKSSLKDLIASTEDLLRSTAAYSGSEVEGVRNRLQHQLEAARDQLHQGEKHARRQYRDISRAGERYVHEHPWRIAGWAVGLGVLAGACILYEQSRRRCWRKPTSPARNRKGTDL